MKSFRSVLIATATAVATTGCFSSSTLVHVRADGSGTIEVRTAVRKAGLAQVAAMSATDMQWIQIEEWLPENAARDAAAKLGSDVRVASTKMTDTKDAFVRVSTYEFTHVAMLTLEPIPLLPESLSHSSDTRIDGEHRFTFDYTVNADGRRVLLARFPDARLEHTGFAMPATESSPDEKASTHALLNGAALEVIIETELPVVQANTPHRRGNRITLLGLDVATILRNERAIPRFFQPGSFDELRFELHEVPGVTVGLDREIRIELGAPGGGS